MYFNNYRQAISALRERNVEPPFEEIRAMVFHQRRSRKFLPISFWLFASATPPLLLALSILFFPEIFGLQRIEDRSLSFVNRQSPVAAGNSVTLEEHHSVNADPISLIRNIPPAKEQTANREIQRSADQPLQKLSEPQQIKDDQQKTKSIQPSAQDQTTAQPPIQTNDDRRLTNDEKKFSLFISGGLPPVHSTFSMANLFYGSAGLRYHLNSVSSLVFEVRRNVFIQKYTANKLTLRDTVLTVGGQTYHNTIGEFSQVPRELTNPLFSLGAGYRYAFTEFGSFIPFAEVLLGASSQGGITSGAAGIGYSFSSPFSLELFLRTDQLFSRNSSPQTAFNISGSVIFTW